MTHEEETLREENARLRARIRELEFERTRSERDAKDVEDEVTADIAADLPGRAFDEVGRLIRGLTLASVEQMRVSAEAVDIFAQEVFRRNRPERARSTGELAFDLPRDLYAGTVKALDHSLNVFSRSARRFNRSFEEAKETQRTRETRETRRESEPRTKHIIIEETTTTDRQDTTSQRSEL